MKKGEDSWKNLFEKEKKSVDLSKDIPTKLCLGGMCNINTTEMSDTMMGSLAMRMASRDMIDNLNLGKRGRTNKSKQQIIQDSSNMYDQAKEQNRQRVEDYPDTHFDKDELEKGIKREMEHTNDPKIAKKIAKEHLLEYTNYYTRLDNALPEKH
jgi:hypothetical protein